MGAPKLTEDEINNRIPSYLKIDFSTFTSTVLPARFIDSKYGEFWNKPWNVFRANHALHPIRYRDEICLKIQMQLPQELTLVFDSFQGYRKAVTLIDCEYGAWKVLLSNVLGPNKQIHPKRAKKLLFEVVKLTEEEINSRLPSHIKINYNTYKGVGKKAEFVDEKYGSWYATVNSVLAGKNPLRGTLKREETCIKKYGFKHRLQNPEEAKKLTKSNGSKYYTIHWKTKKLIQCTGRYELNVIEFFNKINIDFDFQIPFLMPCGRTYICDLYIIDWDLYIEIKGKWFRNGKEKWDWFKEEKHNSALWQSSDLKLIGIHPVYTEKSRKELRESQDAIKRKFDIK